MAGCDTTEAARGRLLELSDICEQYGMEDFVKEKMTLSDGQLVRQFAAGISQPFLAYKENASINRALLKCNLKEKALTKAEQKVLDVVASEREEARQRRRQRADKKNGKLADGRASAATSRGRMQSKMFTGATVDQDGTTSAQTASHQMRTNTTGSQERLGDAA